MLIDISKIQIKEDFDKAQALFALHTLTFFLAKFYEFFKFNFSFSTLVGLIFWFIFYRLFYRMQKRVHYSFWSLAGIIVVTVVFNLIRSLYHYNDFSLFFLYVMSTMLLLMLCYSLYTPVFYPVISWWEYDFRYRNDLKAKVTISDEEFDARLVDLRRKAAGLSLFENCKIGDEVQIRPSVGGIDKALTVEIASKRQHSIGRPYTYGVKFILRDEEERELYTALEKYWNFERKSKKNLKFKS